VDAHGAGHQRHPGAVAGAQAAVAQQRDDPRGGDLGILDHRPRLGARHERAVGAVAAVGERLGDEAQAGSAGGPLVLGPGCPNNASPPSHALTAAASASASAASRAARL